MASANNSKSNDYTCFNHFQAIEEDKKKKEKEMERRWCQRINNDFSPPGSRDSEWKHRKPDGLTNVTTLQPGSLKEWACFKIRKEERLALEIKKERAWDSLPGGWLDDATIQKAMEKEGFTDPWNQLDLHYCETPDEFTNWLIEEARKLMNEGQTSEEDAMAEAVKKMTTF